MEAFTPRSFGRYTLVDHIATGGMADIFAAVGAPPDVLRKAGVEATADRVIVVKRIHPQLVDPEFVGMFINEARISALLAHPNIVQIYDFGSVADRYFIAMEWVPGKTAKDLLKKVSRARRTVPPELVMMIAHQVCKALGYAHSGLTDAAGNKVEIIHRDVSLSNILMSYRGDVKLADFGIAKILGTTDATESGMLKGKFAYMSPEQVDGDPATHRSDLFSLGVVMWELLTARRLFKTDSQVRTLKAVQSKHAEPPSLKAEGIPGDLDALVLRLLEKDPAKRFQSATAVLDALDDAMTLLPRARTDSLGRFMDRIFYRERAEDRARIEAGKLKVLRGEILPETPGKEAEPTILTREPPVRERTPLPRRREEPDSGDHTPISREPTPTKGRSFALLLDQLSQYYAHAEGEAPRIRGRLLIVDDLEENRELLGRTLQKFGHEVHVARTGDEALQIVNDLPPDVLLLDVNMPGKDGFEVLREIRTRFTLTELPIIMVSARDANADIVKALSEGANDYVTKPFDRQVVAARVHTQLLIRLGFETLVAMDERYRAYTENTADLVFQITTNGTLLFVSRASTKLLGYRVHELVGQPFFDYVHKDDKKLVHTCFVDVMTKGRATKLVHRLVTKKGTSVWVETYCQPVVDKQSPLTTGLQGSSRDVSEYVVEEAGPPRVVIRPARG
jgi:PAS domain S-box-containing protein